jgi:DivIVA domain-containing protein
MAVSGIDLLVPPGPERIREQEFERVRSGYDADQVQEYLGRVADVVESLEKDLRDARAQRDNLRHRLAKARDDAYEQLAHRMASVLGAADHQAEKLRMEAEQEAGRQLSDARKEADRLRRNAQAEVLRIRREGEQVLRTVRVEVEEIIGGLVARRSALLTELRGMKERLNAIVGDLYAVTSAPPAMPDIVGSFAGQQPAGEPSAAVDLAEPPEDPQVEELLSSAEGFDLVIHDVLADDERPDSPIG